MTYFGDKKLDMKSVRVETEDNYYDFTCDEEFIGGYDSDLKAWFDYELFDMDDSTSWLNEWLAAKSVTATFTGTPKKSWSRTETSGTGTTDNYGLSAVLTPGTWEGTATFSCALA